MEKKEETYSGDTKKGKRHGFGRCDREDGTIFAGEWKNGKEHGYGMELGENGGITYLGEFTDGVYNGFGTLYPAKGNKEQLLTSGEWNKGVLEGMGLLISPNDGPSYAGLMKNYKSSDNGCWYYADGSIKACISNERKETAVTLHVNNDGSHSVTHFENGVLHGVNIRWDSDGTYFVYKYTNGELLDPVMGYCPDGTIIVGDMVDDRFNGDVYFYGVDGSKIVKQFLNGVQTGDVTVTSSDGKTETISMKAAKKRNI